MNEAIKLAIEKGGWQIRPTLNGKGVAFTYIFCKGVAYKTVIDLEDLSKVGKRKWHMNVPGGYVISWINGKRVRMHHAIMGKPPTGKEVDHISRIRSDNRKVNLRFVSRSVNGHNTIAVGIRKHGNLYEANICLNYKKHYASFLTKKEAIVWREAMKSNYLKTV